MNLVVSMYVCFKWIVKCYHLYVFFVCLIAEIYNVVLLLLILRGLRPGQTWTKQDYKRAHPNFFLPLIRSHFPDLKLEQRAWNPWRWVVVQVNQVWDDHEVGTMPNQVVLWKWTCKTIQQGICLHWWATKFVEYFSIKNNKYIFH